ncbi:hypothetical protein [Bacillus subtilis]|uniref:hypothetical protein n=1 Tax=Bacillus subtilis TaxID=1423 RepID=UPI0015F6F775|nr:hypothetical protein [Bacillus subtilis]
MSEKKPMVQTIGFLFVFTLIEITSLGETVVNSHYPRGEHFMIESKGIKVVSLF